MRHAAPSRQGRKSESGGYNNVSRAHVDHHFKFHAARRSLVQRKAVDLPPVLTLFAVLALGVLFGPLGVLLATPLAVVLLVAVKQLYVRDALDRPTRIPGAGN